MIIPPDLRTNPRTILVVDDSEFSRDATVAYLQSFGFQDAEFLQAADGAEAIDVLEKRPVDLVLTDLNMPNIDGVALVRRVLADPGLREMPVIVISSSVGVVERSELQRLGVGSILQKPLSGPETADAITDVLANRRQARPVTELQPFVSEVLAEVFESMFFLGAVPSTRRLDFAEHATVCATIELGSPGAGWLHLAMTHALAARLCTMLSPKSEATDARSQGLACEISNVLAGRLETKIASDTTITQVGLPVVVDSASAFADIELKVFEVDGEFVAVGLTQEAQPVAAAA